MEPGHEESRAHGDEAPVAFAANDVRLSPREWLVAAALVAIVGVLTPAIWPEVAKFDPGPAYRLPYRSAEDYWLYRRLCRRMAATGRTLVVGDSVIWGHYVAKEQTLSQWMNALSGEDAFANLGVDGTHPAALAGLVEHYGVDIRGRRVILHCNLLWMSSKRRDLQTEKEFAFNHPRLVPQFWPGIPCYREELSKRLGIVIEREVPFFSWANHVRSTYLDGGGLSAWTLAHPYGNPVGDGATGPPSPDEPPSPRPVAKPWTEKGIPRFSPPWVPLEGTPPEENDPGERRPSIQWRAFRRTVEVLKRRRNSVFVLVGPFNEHMLTADSLATYRERKRQVASWLRQAGIAHLVAPVLPSELYADASHPLSQGYAIMARDVLQCAAFRDFQGEAEAVTAGKENR